MADDPPPLVQVYLTVDPLASGTIEASWARIEGSCAYVQGFPLRCFAGEGVNWHRTRWAAENYARQLQAAKLAELRAEVARIEGYRFGRPGS